MLKVFDHVHPSAFIDEQLVVLAMLDSNTEDFVDCYKCHVLDARVIDTESFAHYVDAIEIDETLHVRVTFIIDDVRNCPDGLFPDFPWSGTRKFNYCSHEAGCLEERSDLGFSSRGYIR